MEIILERGRHFEYLGPCRYPRWFPAVPLVFDEVEARVGGFWMGARLGRANDPIAVGHFSFCIRDVKEFDSLKYFLP